MADLQTIREAVASVALAPLPDDDQVSLFDLGVLDSFALLNLVRRLEQACGVTIPPRDVIPRRFETLARITALVQAHRS